jgi:hypothetical protein
MSEQRSKQTEIENVSRVDYLLGLLGNLSQRDPSPILRQRLEVLASRRLKEKPDDSARLTGRGRRTPVWLKPVFVAALLAIGLVTVLVVYLQQHKPAPADRTAKVSHPAVSPKNEVPVALAPMASIPRRQPMIQHPQPIFGEPANARRMTLQLPYSNSAIETGTAATIWISMSQSELLSLGFPVNATVQDRRIVAELTLGDDGLPRAISLPLPLEVIKEKK